MPQQPTCLVAVRGADAPPPLHAAARAEGGSALPAARDGTRVFGFDGVAAALRFARAVVTRPDPAGGCATGAGLALRAEAHAADHVAGIAAALAARAPPGGITVSAAVQARIEAHRADPCALAPSADTPAPDAAAGITRIGRFELDPARFDLRRDGARVHLEPRTFDLLALLARNIGRTVTRDEILDRVWGGRIVSDAAISSQIKAARQALDDDGRRQRIIATVHGRGFRLRAAAAAPAAVDPGPAAAHPPVSRRPTLVALPFTNLDEDGRGAIVARGLTEDLINALTRTRWLCVIPRNPAFALERSGTDPDRIAQTLGADYLLTGSLRRDGNRVRITARATDARSMRCLWSETFDRQMRDIFDLQQEIASLVAARLATELGISEQRRAARTPRANLGAWEYLS